ncbi:phage tail protein [Micromonospora sp. WMMD737]|uniref:phage tail protein n=1 Tax=Micromonospora sp. WMMD737 TaxID=3404113 RepID=UPI003B926DCC
MTSPAVVGAVAVEVTATAKGFARRMRDAVVAEFKSAEIEKAITDSLGGRKIKIPVEAQFDKKSLVPPAPPRPPATPRTTTPREKTPDVDGLMRAFRDDVQRQLRALGREAVRIPVSADTDALRADLARRIDQVQRNLKIEVPTEPGARGDYERSLRTMLADVTNRVRGAVPPVRVPVKPDPIGRAFQTDIQRQITAISREANTRIPVRADTTRVRQDIAAQLAAIERTMKAEIPTEPAGRLAYEARLRAMVAAASRSVKVSIPVDVDYNRFQRAVAGLATRLPAGVGAGFQQLANTVNAAGSAVMSTMAASANALFSVVNPATAAAVAVGGTVAALLLAGPAAAAAAGAIGVVAGALASLPTLLTGGAGIIGTLALGLRGLGDAFKKTGASAGGAGQSAAAGARQIAAAERSIAQAQRGLAAAERTYQNALRESLRAQNAINDARRAATRRLQDVARAARGAALDERDAALRIREAEQALREAFRSRDPLEYERAQLELEQAQLAAEEATQAAKDAAEAKIEADKKGIEGSDEVVAAMERQRAANDQLLAAADGLKSAQESLTAANEQLAAAQEKTGSSAGGVAKEMIKLAPAAQEFVDALKSMKPAFEDLRLDVQQRLFAGLDDTVRRVGSKWLPQLKTTLGSYADTFNGFFKDLGKNITQPKFMADFSAGAENARQMIERIGKSVSGPLVDAFGRLSRAAKPFTDAIGEELGGLIDDFGAWIKSADESGKLEAFFEKASGFLRDTFRLGRAVGSIFKSITQILFGADNNGKGSGFLETMESLAEFLNDPENQRKLSEYVDMLKEFSRFLLTEVIPRIAAVGFWFMTTKERIDGAAETVRTALSRVRDAVTGFVDGTTGRLESLTGRIDSALRDIPVQVSGFFSEAHRRASEIVTVGLDNIQQRYAGLRGRVQQALQSVPGVVAALMNTSVGRGVTSLATLPARGAAAVAGLAGRIRSTLSGLRGQMYQIGLNVVYGLWDGITALGGWFRAHIRNFAWEAVKAFKIGFEVRSPSKLMAREVGRWLPPGIAVGMDSAIGTVEAARDRMIAAAVPDTSDQYALKIAPVVDPYAGVGAATLSTPPAGRTDVTLRFDGDAPGSFFAWVRDNIRVDFGGDANAAFGRAPTPVLAR